MSSRETIPDLERLSIIAAAIMLAFALTQLASFPAPEISFLVIGVQISFSIDFNTIITILTAILAAAGMDWLIDSHPLKASYHTHWYHVRHWIVPVLTTLVIGVALNTFAGEMIWWMIYAFGSLLLTAVFIAEFNVIAVEQDLNHPLATIGLTGLSFALYLLLAITVYTIDLRLVFRLPILGVGALMVVSRTLYLRTGKWQLMWSVITSVIISQIVIAFQYLPLNATQFGVILVGAAYALTSFVTAIKESREKWALWAEPLAMLVIIGLVSLVWR